MERWLPRAQCKRGCPSFVHERPGELYPHRQYQLDVVADVVGAIALGDEAPAKAAARATASKTSAYRWTSWVARLAGVGTLLALAHRADPDAVAGAGLSATATASPVRALAAQVLAALEHLGTALLRSGLALASRTGLGRVLEWQLRQHGDVIHLVAEPRSLSPGLALGLAGGAL